MGVGQPCTCEQFSIIDLGLFAMPYNNHMYSSMDRRGFERQGLRCLRERLSRADFLRNSSSLIQRSPLLATAMFMLVACEPQYVYTDCLLPTLSLDVEVRTVLNMGAEGDLSSDSCPVPAARKFEARRSYGTVQFGWWGSPHKLYIAVSADDGRSIDVRGDGIEAFENPPGSWLSEFSYQKRFPVHNLVFSPEPETESFAIEILESDGSQLETIDATYDTMRCSCAVPEFFAQ